jgi:hypothetical protein
MAARAETMRIEYPQMGLSAGLEADRPVAAKEISVIG